MAERIGLEAILDMAKFNGNVDNYLRAVNKMDSETGSIGQRVGQSFDAVGKGMLAAAAVAATAAVAVTAAIAAFVVDGVKKAASLDEGMARIAASLNLTKDAVKPLKDAILELGLDPKLKVTADEAAIAIESLAKNGLNMDQILAGAARTTVLLANATGADFGAAADIATDTMAIFNFKAEEMGEAINGIVGVTNASKLTIDDYRLALGQAGGAAAFVGVGFEDFNTTLASIAPFFQGGSSAGTGFKNMLLLGLLPQSKKALSVMKEVGLYTGLSGEEFTAAEGKIAKYKDQLAKLDPESKKFVEKSTELTAKIKLLEDSLVGGQNAFYDANGSLKDMNTIAVILQDALGGLSDMEANLTLKTMFGTDASVAAFGVMKSGIVVYETATEAAAALGITVEEAAKAAQGGITQFEAMQLQIAKIDAEEQAATRMDNLKGKIEILRGQIDTLKLSIGDKLLPVLGDLTKWASEFVATHSQSVIDFFGNMVKGIGDTVTKIQEGQPFFDALTGGLQTGFGDNGKIIGENIAAIAKSVNDFYTAVTTILQPLTDAVTGFVSWRDVLIVLAGAVAVVVIPAIVSMVAAVAAIVIPIAGAVLAVAALRTAWEADFGGLRTKVTEALDAVSLRFADLTTAIATHGQGALREIVAFATGNETSWTSVKAIWTEASTAGSKLFADLQGYVTSNLPGWQAKMTEWGTAASDWITNAVPLATQKIGEWFTQLASSLTEKIPQWKDEFLLWADATWQWLGPAAVAAGLEIGTWVLSLIADLGKKIPDWIVATLKLATGLVSWITSEEANAIPHLGEWLGKAIAWIVIAGVALAGAFIGWVVKDLIPKVAPEMGKFLFELLGGLAKITGAIVVGVALMAAAMISTWYTVIKAKLDEFFAPYKQAFVAWASETWGWITNATTETLAAIVKWYTELKAKLDENLALFKLGFVAWRDAAWEWITNAQALTVTKLGEWWVVVSGWADTNLPLWQAKMTEFGTSANKWIDDAKSLVAGKLGEWQTKITEGIASVSVSIIESIATLATDMYNKLLNGTSWRTGGQDIVDKIKNGFISMMAAMTNKAGQLATDMWQKFKDIDWPSLGKDIVQGIIDGFDALKDDLINRAKMLADDLPAWMKKLLGIESPSKVFFAIGENVMLGFINGMDSLSNRAAETIGRIADNTISRAKSAGYGASGLIAGVIGGFQGSGKGFAEGLTADLNNIQAALNKVYSTPRTGSSAPVDVSSLLTRQYAEIGGDKYRTGTALSDRFSRVKPGSEAAALEAEYNKSKAALVYNAMLNDQTEQLKKQADLIKLVRDSGGDPSAVLGNLLNAATGIDNQKYLTVINQITETLNNKLAKSINAVKSNFDGTINVLAEGRISLAAIEQQFNGQTIDQQKNLTKIISLFDEYIATKEASFRVGEGDAGTLEELRAVTENRNNAAQQLVVFMRQKAEFQALQSRLGANITDPTQSLMKTYNLDPILARFSAIGQTEETRNQLMIQYRMEQEKILTLQRQQAEFQALQNRLVGANSNALVAGIQASNLDPLMARFSAINTTEQERNQLIAQYRMEQEKILAIQQKQQQVTFLSDQLALLKQAQDLAKNFPGLVNVQEIFAGMKLGIGASADDLLGAVSRTMDAVIRTTNAQLGIASPSKVFAKIGEYTMQGFAQGITSGVKMPAMSMANAASTVAQAPMISRNFTMNTGPVNINNGMNEASFKAMIRSEVGKML